MNSPRNGEGDRAKRSGGGSDTLRKPETYAARKLRRRMSLPEVLLWQELRERPGGFKFRRQHPVGPYVGDFYAREAALVIEVDGQAHDGADAARRDEMRDREMAQRGLTVMRIRAAEVIQDMDGVVAAIVARAESPLHHASHGPPPRAGEDL